MHINEVGSTSNVFLVYLNLCLRDTGDDTPLFDDLSERTGLERRHVAELVDYLVSQGLVRRLVQFKNGRRMRNVYQPVINIAVKAV